MRVTRECFRYHAEAQEIKLKQLSADQVAKLAQAGAL